MVDESTPSGWYQDPSGQGDGRYWNGTAWTSSVNRGGVVVDVPIDAERAQQPPFPGTRVKQPASTIAQPAPVPTSTVPPVVVQSAPQGGSGFGAILAIIAIVFFVTLMIFAISNSSSDENPDGEPAPTAEPPAEGG